MFHPVTELEANNDDKFLCIMMSYLLSNIQTHVCWKKLSNYENLYIDTFSFNKTELVSMANFELKIFKSATL